MPDRDKVLGALKCGDGETRGKILSVIEKTEENAVLCPRVLIESADDFTGTQNKILCVIITVGSEISEYSNELFNKGEFLAGLVADVFGSEALFELDARAADIIREECALLKMGVSERLDAPDGIPFEYNKKILALFEGCGIRLTDRCMYDPPKTIAYILKLTPDKDVFRAQHDCSKCPNRSCPRRSLVTEEIKSVSAHENIVGNSGADILCVDIGTTTLAFERISGDTKTVFTEVNRQRRFGADVISRIEASNRGHKNELRSIVEYQISEGISRLYEGHKIPDTIVVSANTVMVQLLMGYSCEKLGAYPFEPESKAYTETAFKYRGHKITMRIFPAVSAFIGGDIVSGMYLREMSRSEDICLFIDLGTNGEMALGNSRGITAASAAAGPAFEGGRISRGCGSVDGAVCGVNLKTGELSTINGAAPRGICGTGIVELLSEMLDLGIMDKTGLLGDRYFESGFEFAKGMFFTQKDIREIQTAKAAVRAGIEILMKNTGTEYGDIKRVYIAGGFGFGLNIRKACNIGLIPPELEGKCAAIGNSSLGGAVKFALNPGDIKIIERTAEITRELILAEDPDFNQIYLRNMSF